MAKRIEKSKLSAAGRSGTHPIFLNFLLEEGYITTEQASKQGHRPPSHESWIGRMMINHGLITVEQVNDVLIRQDFFGGFFGENAVTLGLITREQLETLLASQELRRNIELIEELALSNTLNFNEGLAAMAKFYSQRVAARTSESQQQPEPVG